MTVADVIANTGGGVDAEDVFKARRQELDMMAENDLIFDTDPAQVTDKGQAQPLPPAQEGDGAEAEQTESPAQESVESIADGDEITKKDK